MSIETYEAITNGKKITVNYLDDEYGRQLVTELKVSYAEYAAPSAIGEAVASHLSERTTWDCPPMWVIVNGVQIDITFAVEVGPR